MTTTPDFIVRDATIEDVPGILEVIEAAFGTWPAFDIPVSPLEHLDWKMSPRDGLTPAHTVIELDSRIMAAELRWERRFQVGDTDYESEVPADTAVHPDYQGRGLMRRLHAAVHDALVERPRPGVSALSNAPQVRHTNDPDLLERNLTTWFRPFALRTQLSVQLRAGGVDALWRAGAARLASRRSTRGLKRQQISVRTRFDQRIDALWEQARREFDIILFRNAGYLNWRYARPSGTSSFLTLDDGDRTRAYAVVRESGRTAALMDFLWLPDDQDALRTIVRAAVAHARGIGARGIECALPEGHVAESALRAAGFAVVGHQTLLLGTRTSGENPLEAVELLVNPARTMHLTMGDLDQH